jgi:hypothetical protein
MLMWRTPVRRYIHFAPLMTVLFACGGVVSTQQNLEPGLIVLPDGFNVRRVAIYDGSVEYDVPDPYPGSVVIRTLGDRMKESGWSETDEFPGPDQTTKTTRTWSSYLQGDQRVESWSGGWKNGAGDLVLYFLTYKTKPNEPAVRVHVKVLRMTAGTVARFRR